MKINPVYLLIIFLLTGCASNIPLEIREDLPNNATADVKTVRQHADAFVGKKIRWGGTIVGVENKTGETWIELVGTDLNSYGRPVNLDQTHGRFLVRIDGFLDPEIYKANRRLTIYGTIESRITRQIDDYPYVYPLVKAQSYYLWREYDYHRRYVYHYPYYYPYPYYFSLHYGHHFGHFHRHHYGFGLHHHFHHW